MKAFKAIFVCLSLFSIFSSGKAQQRRPNILVIITDQQSSTDLSIAGNKWVKTPHLDKLAKRGVRFTKAYASNSVCVPSKFSMQTGLFASRIGVRYNEYKESEINASKNNEIIKNALGWKFRKAGYRTVFGGKVHLPGYKHGPISKYGYSLLGTDGKIVHDAGAEDRQNIIMQEWNNPALLAKAGSKFLEIHKNDKQPFILFLSFIPPHDICYFTIRSMKPNSDLAKATPDKLLKVVSEMRRKQKEEGIRKFFSHPNITSEDFNPYNYAPPLPGNFEPMAGEPQAIRDLIALRPFREKARRVWGEKGWREHRWIYARLTNIADSLIGTVLHSLDATGLQKNTIVAFTSDHGDNDASHRLEHKTVFYDEASRIPLFFAGKGIKRGQVVHHQVNMGLDLYPTLLDLAGITPADRLPGISLKPYLEGKEPSNTRKYVLMENQIGFMVTDGRFKYAWYDKTNEEMFIDLKNDPGEEVNLMSKIYRQQYEHRDKYKELQKALMVHLKQLNQQGANINIEKFRKIFHDKSLE